jgi:FixJ family two-component response regulator
MRSLSQGSAIREYSRLLRSFPIIISLAHAKVRHLAVPCELVDWKIAMTIKPSIAVVDDDESVREATTRLLRSLGFIAKGFSSPDEFLSSNRQHITSYLIADVQMRGISGLALYGQLIAAGNPIPTILITAYPDDAICERTLNAGVAAYLIKPFSEKELLDSIDTVLKHKELLAPIKS